VKGNFERTRPHITEVDSDDRTLVGVQAGERAAASVKTTGNAVGQC
jgi:hypothetical protein